MSDEAEDLPVKAYILIQTQVGKPASVAHEASRVPGVSSAEPVTGPYDVIVQAEGRNLDELARSVIRRIQEIDGVTRTLTCPVVHI